MDEIDTARQFFTKSISELYHHPDISRLDDMAMVGVAVTKMEKQMHVGRYVAG